MSELKWYEKEGNLTDTVSSTRVRLARNLREYSFPDRASKEEKSAVEEKVREALFSGNSLLSNEFRFVPLKDLTDLQAVSLVERHVISPQFVSDQEGKAVLVNEDEGISIMINEEDHLRIQVMRSGMALKETAETADRLDTLLGETLNFAFDRELGYLTQCPTNLGIGMRASVMLSLPALSETGALSRMALNLSKLGMTLRGSYGEGTKAIGSMYQLSNQVTLGLSESEALMNLSGIANQLIDSEKKTRRELAENLAVQDRIYRASGTLKNARLLSSEECIGLLSEARLGLAVGLLSGLNFEELDALSIKVQPCTLSEIAGRPLGEGERDAFRAELVRETCKNLKE